MAGNTLTHSELSASTAMGCRDRYYQDFTSATLVATADQGASGETWRTRQPPPVERDFSHGLATLHQQYPSWLAAWGDCAVLLRHGRYALRRPPCGTNPSRMEQHTVRRRHAALRELGGLRRTRHYADRSTLKPDEWRRRGPRSTTTVYQIFRGLVSPCSTCGDTYSDNIPATKLTDRILFFGIPFVLCCFIHHHPY